MIALRRGFQKLVGTNQMVKVIISIGDQARRLCYASS